MAEMTELVFDLLRNERARQNEKWGEQYHTPYFWMLILQEELGEAARALLEGDSAQAVKELVHAGAVIVAWIEDILRRENLAV